MTAALRVAFDVSSTRGRKTGIGAYTELLVRALRESAPEVEVIELPGNTTVAQRTPTRIFREQVSLPRAAHQAKADVLHLTGFACPWRSNVPTVLTVHDLIGALFPQNLPPVARIYWSWYLPSTVRFATQVIADSTHTKNDILRLTGVSADRIQVIPFGPASRFQPVVDEGQLSQVRMQVGLPERYFVFVGTIEPRKGVDTLVAAYGRVAPSVAEDLVIVGKRGWYIDSTLGAIRSAGLAHRVHLLDYVSDEALPALYSMATACVLPSRYEGLGLPTLEAMACGTPVICSNVSSLPEVVGNAAMLVAADDVVRFANAMQHLADDSDARAKYRELGFARVGQYQWSDVARQTAAVYRAAVEGRGAGH